MSSEDNLGPQFPTHGYVSLNDHRESLGLNENFGNVGLHPTSMQKTGESVDVPPTMPLTPGQGTVYAEGVHKYIEKPNESPISLYHDAEGSGETYVLEGHHRLTAARLSGRTLRGEYWRDK